MSKKPIFIVKSVGVDFLYITAKVDLSKETIYGYSFVSYSISDGI